MPEPVVEAAFAVPGDLASPTGGYAYARHLLAHLPGCGIRVEHLPLPGGFPAPEDAALAEAADRLASVPAGRVLLVDGLAYGAMPAERLRAVRAPMVALVHHPLALESGLAPEPRARLAVSERAALSLARRVVATSAHTARGLVGDYGVRPDAITVAEPGTEPARRARGSGEPLALLAVGAVTPRKAFPLLVEALRAFDAPPWRLTIVGTLDRDPGEAARLRAAVLEAGLGDRVVLAGAVDAAGLDALHDAADLLVSASLYEGYGMALAEGIARGLPVVAASGGAAAETVPPGCGLLVPPGDAAALRDALGRMLADPAFRRGCADAAWTAARTLPRWEDTAARVAEALRAAT